MDWCRARSRLLLKAKEWQSTSWLLLCSFTVGGFVFWSTTKLWLADFVAGGLLVRVVTRGGCGELSPRPHPVWRRFGSLRMRNSLCGRRPMDGAAKPRVVGSTLWRMRLSLMSWRRAAQLWLRVRRMLLSGGPGVPLPSLRRLRPLRSTVTSLLSWCARCLRGRVGVGEGLRPDPLAFGWCSASRRSSGFSLSSFSSTTTTVRVFLSTLEYARPCHARVRSSMRQYARVRWSGTTMYSSYQRTQTMKFTTMKHTTIYGV